MIEDHVNRSCLIDDFANLHWSRKLGCTSYLKRLAHLTHLQTHTQKERKKKKNRWIRSSREADATDFHMLILEVKIPQLNTYFLGVKVYMHICVHIHTYLKEEEVRTRVESSF